MKLEIQHTLTPTFAERRFFVHPPEPPAEILDQDPRNAVYLTKTRIFHTPFYWNHLQLANPHIAVIGITGSGKSVLCKTLITRANLVWGTSTLILDWAGEYIDWVKQTGGRVVKLGKGDYINLLDLGGMKPLNRVKQILQSLELLTDLKQYPEQIRWTQYALEAAYVQKGFKLHEHSNRKPPSLKDVETVLAHQSAKHKGYSPEKREIDGTLHRIKQLTAKGNDYFAQNSTLKLDDLLGKGLACVDLSGLPTEALRSLGGLTLIQFAREKMRDAGWTHEKGLKQFILLDEAWKICQDNTGEETDPIAIIREGRKYQFALIVASQNPTDISKKIFSNVGTMFAFRIKYPEYLDYLQNTLRFSNRIRNHLQDQAVGECIINQVYTHTTPYPETFALERVDAQELVKEYCLEFMEGGEKMAESLCFEKNELMQKLKTLGVSQNTLNELASSFEKNRKHYPVTNFIIDLERGGLGRSVVTRFLKHSGVPDYTLAKIYCRADSKKAENAATVQLELKG